MSIFHRFLSISVFIVAPVGCASPDSTSDSALITPQFSQSATTAGNLENPSTTIALPTSTSKPNATPDITKTAIAQEINSAQFAEQTLIAPYPRACKNLYFPREFSPNGSWMAESCYSESDESLILTLSNC